eukprot:17936-Eustigmatos_ZCMA.PRE.1
MPLFCTVLARYPSHALTPPHTHPLLHVVQEHAVFDGTSLPVEHGELMFTGPDDEDSADESDAAAKNGGSGGEGD